MDNKLQVRINILKETDYSEEQALILLGQFDDFVLRQYLYGRRWYVRLYRKVQHVLWPLLPTWYKCYVNRVEYRRWGVQGKRVELEVNEDGHIVPPEPGSYGKDASGEWWCTCPNDAHLTGRLGKHTVVENEDGTITVSPSILVEHWSGVSWHGYLENGVWREV